MKLTPSSQALFNHRKYNLCSSACREVANKTQGVEAFCTEQPRNVRCKRYQPVCIFARRCQVGPSCEMGKNNNHFCSPTFVPHMPSTSWLHPKHNGFRIKARMLPSSFHLIKAWTGGANTLEAHGSLREHPEHRSTQMLSWNILCERVGVFWHLSGNSWGVWLF